MIARLPTESDRAYARRAADRKERNRLQNEALKIRRAEYGTRTQRLGLHMTHGEIAKELGVTKQRIHQIERVALMKLRALLVREGFTRNEVMMILNNL